MSNFHKIMKKNAKKSYDAVIYYFIFLWQFYPALYLVKVPHKKGTKSKTFD